MFLVFLLFRTFYAYGFSCDIVLTLRSVRDPGLPPGAFALPRCAPQGGCDKGLDDELMSVLMDGIE